MKTLYVKILIGLSFLAFACHKKVPVNQDVLKLHPQNSHYFCSGVNPRC